MILGCTIAAAITSAIVVGGILLGGLLVLVSSKTISGMKSVIHV